MENKYFMHRIKKDNGAYTTGIEVHDTLDSAVNSYHAQMKMAYDNPSFENLTFMSCKVTGVDDAVVPGYDETWAKDGEEITDFFMHYIRHDGDTYTKGIDVCPDIETARRTFHAQMEYGNNNSKFPNVSFVASMITGRFGDIEKAESWTKPEPEPEPEPTPEEPENSVWSDEGE